MDPSEVQWAIDRVSRLRLIRLPTPLHGCPRLADRLGGPRIFIKRDDLTGLAFGGNKSRYLEFTLAEAVDAGADAVVLTAVVQSNHCRQLAAAAARVGLKAVLVLREDESPMGRHDPPTANDLLDRLFGAEIRFAQPDRVQSAVAEAADFIGLSCTPDPAHIRVDDGYVGSGFGALDATTRKAIHLLARTEGILVDPTYTGKAFAGLLDHIRRHRIGPDQDVVFVHTGGTPLTFAYGDQLL